MPALQTVNFGNDPYADAFGGFVKNFTSVLNEKSAQKRNEDLFKRIKEKYPSDVKPEQLFADVLSSNGMDQDYKRDLLGEIKQYADLATKKDKTLYDEAVLEQRRDELLAREEGNRINEIRVQNQGKALENATAKGKKDLPKAIADYSDKLLKDSDVKLRPQDKAELNSFIEQLVEDGESINKAFPRALEFIEKQKVIVDDGKITPRTPEPFFGQLDPKKLNEDMEKASADLQRIHDEDGITSQRDLRSIAERSGWKPEETTRMLQRVFQRAGKKLKGPSVKTANNEASVDDILFGE